MKKACKCISFNLTILLFVIFFAVSIKAANATGSSPPATPQVETLSVTNADLSSATLNGNISNTGNKPCDIRTFLYRAQGSEQWLSAESTSTLVNNLTATFDGMMMTALVATIHPSVTKIEVYKGDNKLVEWTGEQLQSLFVQYLLGAATSDVLTIKAYTNGTSTNYNVNVQTYQPLYNEGSFNMKLTGLSPAITYEFKAIVHNSAGWGEGTIQTFRTKGDINDDGIINVNDLLWMASRIGPANTDEIKKADVNNDGKVNILDLEAVANID